MASFKFCAGAIVVVCSRSNVRTGILSGQAGRDRK